MYGCPHLVVDKFDRCENCLVYVGTAPATTPGRLELAINNVTVQMVRLHSSEEGLSEADIRALTELVGNILAVIPSPKWLAQYLQRER